MEPPSSRVSTEFPRTDSGNAERLVEAHGKDFRYVHDQRKWLHWDGTRWSADSTEQIHRAAKATIRAAYSRLRDIVDDKQRTDFAAFLRQSESRRSREAMVVLASKEQRVSCLSSQFDTDPLLLNVRNGTIDLRTNKLREHRREDMLTKLCHVAYEPSARCDRWRQFLAEIFPGKPDIIEFLQRSLGYSLTGSIEEQCFWLLIGGGKNGKSKFLDAIQFVLGDYAVETNFNTFAARRRDSAISPRDGLACLVGSRFVRASESDREKRISEALLKALTGGESIKTARMYEAEFDYRPTFKIWLSTNHEPMIQGTDDGIWRRIHRLNFDYIVPEEKRDRGLGEKLKAEASGILNWALEGLKSYNVEGLQVPQSVTNATTSYREVQNVVFQFLESAIEKADGAEIEATGLYKAFQGWCEDNTEHRLTQTAFGKEAKNHLRSGRTNTGRTVYLGVKLRAFED
jgi:putative DNA primase/helicase